MFGIDKGIFIQQVNCQGVIGSGLSGAIISEYPQVKDRYFKIYNENEKEMLLGKYDKIDVTDNLSIVNLFTQNYCGADGLHYTDDFLLVKGILAICNENKNEQVYIPKNIGCGLGGANWENINDTLERMCREQKITNLSVIDTLNYETTYPHKYNFTTTLRGHKALHNNTVGIHLFENAKRFDISQEEAFLMGYLHDIGYIRGREGHEQNGFDILENMLANKEMLNAIRYHGSNPYTLSEQNINKYYLALVDADLSVDKDGKDVGWTKRLEDIEKRYGTDSVAFKVASRTVDYLREFEKHNEDIEETINANPFEISISGKLEGTNLLITIKNDINEYEINITEEDYKTIIKHIYMNKNYVNQYYKNLLLYNFKDNYIENAVTNMILEKVYDTRLNKIDTLKERKVNIKSYIKDITKDITEFIDFEKLSEAVTIYNEKVNKLEAKANDLNILVTINDAFFDKLCKNVDIIKEEYKTKRYNKDTITDIPDKVTDTVISTANKITDNIIDIQSTITKDTKPKSKKKTETKEIE